jgi:hypothetical protein
MFVGHVMSIRKGLIVGQSGTSYSSLSLSLWLIVTVGFLRNFKQAYCRIKKMNIDQNHGIEEEGFIANCIILLSQTNIVKKEGLTSHIDAHITR